jgi:hypothetical protein
MTDAHDDDPLPALRAELDSLEQQVARLQDSRIVMMLGRISSLRRQIAALGRQRTAEGTLIATPNHLSTRSR